MKKLLTLVLLTIFAGSCRTSKDSVSGPAFSMIAFGESGGVTGANSQYGLSKTGVLLQTPQGEQEPEMIGKISEEELEKISRMAEKTTSVESFRQEPGNLNRKLLIQVEGSYRNYYWHMPEDTIPTEVTSLYRALSRLVQKASSGS